MTPTDLKTYLDTLNSKQIKLWVEGDKLQYDAEEGALTDQDFEKLKANKQSIIKLLNGKKKRKKAESVEEKIKQAEEKTEQAEEKIKHTKEKTEHTKEKTEQTKKLTPVEKIIYDPKRSAEFLNNLTEENKNGNHHRNNRGVDKVRYFGDSNFTDRQVFVETTPERVSNALDTNCDCGKRIITLNHEGTIGICIDCNITFKVRTQENAQPKF